MIYTRVVIVSKQGNEALVESLDGGGCGKCDKENGCGSSKLSKLFCSDPRRFYVRNEANAQVGSIVNVALPDGMLLNSALIMYLFPLIILLLGAISGGQLSPADESVDMYSAIGGLIGLVSGFLGVKVWLRLHLPSLSQPVILTAASSDSTID